MMKQIWYQVVRPFNVHAWLSVFSPPLGGDVWVRGQFSNSHSLVNHHPSPALSIEKREIATRFRDVFTCRFPLSAFVSIFFVVVAVVWNLDHAFADDERTDSLLKTFVEEFVPITPGEGKFPATFKMGAINSSGKPSQTEVTMKTPFAMARYEVPQNLYLVVMGTNPSRWKGARNSVEMMSWDDANLFCKKLTSQLQEKKLIAVDEIIRLPSEAEWEYCCRAGTTSRYSFGDDAQQEGDVSPKASRLNDFGWHTGNAAGNDPPVGALKPNPWGLYDMHGYLWEFTNDSWNSNESDADFSKSEGNQKNPKNDADSIVLKSGSWKDTFEKLTSASRRPFSKIATDDAVGFRCVKSKIEK